MSKVRVVHVISGLSTGGAEMMLLKLLSSIDFCRFEHQVVSLTTNGPIGELIKDHGVLVECLNMNIGKPSLSPLFNLKKIGHDFRPHIIQGWMYHGNLASSLMGRLLKNKAKVVWNIRHSLHNLKYEKFSTRNVIRLGKMFSGSPSGIIYNANSSKRQHENIGYSAKCSLVFPNGFDTKLFFNNNSDRLYLHKELNLKLTTPLVGIVARFHPMKDHFNFIKAAQLIHKALPDTQFVCVGRGVDFDNTLLVNRIHEFCPDGVFHLLGNRPDIQKIMNSFNVLCSASAFGEGFPNVLGEAMACEVPCVATDVGDSAYVLGEGGTIVPSSDPFALASGIIQILQLREKDLIALGRKGRERVVREFSLKKIAQKYEDYYFSLL